MKLSSAMTFRTVGKGTARKLHIFVGHFGQAIFIRSKTLTEMLAILSKVEFLLAPQVLYTTRPDDRSGKLPKPSTEIITPYRFVWKQY